MAPVAPPVVQAGPEHWLETGRLAELGLLTSELVHELRQPVFAIKALAQLLTARGNGAEAGQLGVLLDQVGVLEELLDRYSGSTRKPSASHAGPLLLGEAVERGVAVVRSRAVRAGVDLGVALDRAGPPVRGDPVAVQQITSNLLSNAIDAARSRVAVRVRGAVLEVEDDGPGIAAEVKDTLFDPFVTTKEPGVGTGLGLAVTRHLVDAAGASLVCKSGASGTCFTVAFLPVEANHGSG
jgi:two-component system C4-dicarboxylate transport sensor histidine kinase DctB